MVDLWTASTVGVVLSLVAVARSCLDFSFLFVRPEVISLCLDMPDRLVQELDIFELDFF
jgi:hypothetical protein